MNVMTNKIYAIGVIIVSVCLIAFAALIPDNRGIIIGALIGYWLREGVSISAMGKATDIATKVVETKLEDTQGK